MDIPDLLLHPAWHAGGWLAVGAGVLVAAAGAPWGRLVPERNLHRFLGAITLLMLAWSLRAGVKPGLHPHVLGTTLLFLMFGAGAVAMAMVGVAATLMVVYRPGWIPTFRDERYLRGR